MSDLIQHDSNFAFLETRDPRLAKLGAEAELLASINPNTCIMQVRLIAEMLATRAAAELGVYDVDALNFYETLKQLEQFQEFGRDIRQVFHDIRANANQVVHGDRLMDAKGSATHYVKLAHKTAVWFYRTLEDPDFSPGPFEQPPSCGRA
jgi:type I restriction enzyme R subunit